MKTLSLGYSPCPNDTYIFYALTHGKVEMLGFSFIERLEGRSPDLSLDWFRRGTGEFEVVMTYANRDDYERSARVLQGAGFRID